MSGGFSPAPPSSSRRSVSGSPCAESTAGGGTVPYRPPLQRSAARVRASHHKRGTKPWRPCAGVTGGVEWLGRHEKEGEGERYASVVVAAEIILKQVYTETGRRGHLDGGGEGSRDGNGRIGGPDRRRTAVACMMLYHIAGIFHRYKDLVCCLLRDVLESVYSDAAADPSLLWDSLCASEEGFFARRAEFVADRFVAHPTYFDQCRTLQAEVEVLRRRSSPLHGSRTRLAACVAAVLRRRAVQVLALALRWWRTLTRLGRTGRERDRRSAEQMGRMVRRYLWRKQRSLVLRCFAALRRTVTESRALQLRRMKMDLEVKKGEIVLTVNEALLCTAKYKACLQLWETWAHSVVSAQPPSYDVGEGDGCDDEQITCSSAIEDASIYVQRFEGLSAMVRNGVLADLELERKRPSVPPLAAVTRRRGRAGGGDAGEGCDAAAAAYAAAGESLERHQELAELLFHSYALSLEGRWCVTVFDVARLVRDCGLAAHRTAVLDAAMSVAARSGDDSGILVPIDAFPDFLTEAAAAVPAEAGAGAPRAGQRVEALMTRVAACVASFAPPDSFEELLRQEATVRAGVQHARALRAAALAGARGEPQGSTLQPEGLAELGLPYLTPAVLASVFAHVCPGGGGASHPVDVLTVTFAAAQASDPLPFATPAKKWIAFGKALAEARARQAGAGRGRGEGGGVGGAGDGGSVGGGGVGAGKRAESPSKAKAAGGGSGTAKGRKRVGTPEASLPDKF